MRAVGRPVDDSSILSCLKRAQRTLDARRRMEEACRPAGRKSATHRQGQGASARRARFAGGARVAWSTASIDSMALAADIRRKYGASHRHRRCRPRASRGRRGPGSRKAFGPIDVLVNQRACGHTSRSLRRRPRTGSASSRQSQELRVVHASRHRRSPCEARQHRQHLLHAGVNRAPAWAITTGQGRIISMTRRWRRGAKQG